MGVLEGLLGAWKGPLPLGVGWGVVFLQQFCQILALLSCHLSKEEDLPLTCNWSNSNILPLQVVVHHLVPNNLLASEYKQLLDIFNFLVCFCVTRKGSQTE